MRTRRNEPSPAWLGDWQNRILERIREKGYKSYLDYLADRPGRTYDELSRELERDDDIAPVQLSVMHARLVEPGGRREAILDSLARSLRGALRKGWGLGRYWESDVAGQLAFWSVAWGRAPELYALEEALRSIPPEEGWIPKDGNDPVLREAARRAWDASGPDLTGSDRGLETDE